MTDLLLSNPASLSLCLSFAVETGRRDFDAGVLRLLTGAERTEPIPIRRLLSIGFEVAAGSHPTARYVRVTRAIPQPQLLAIYAAYQAGRACAEQIAGDAAKVGAPA